MALPINGAPETGKKENMEKFNHILIVDDEESIRFSLAKYLKDAGYVPHPAATPAEAQKMITDRSYAAAIVDRILANGENGLEFLSKFQKKQPFCQAVLISGFPSFESASQAIALKVFAYLAKPVRKDQILQTVAQAVEESRAKSSAALREQIFSHLLGSSPDAVAIYDPAGLAVFVNPAFSSLFGYLRDEAVGHELPEIPESQVKRAERHWARFQAEGKPVQYESLRLAKDGRRLPLLLYLMSIAATEDLPAYTLVIYRETSTIDPEAEKGGAVQTAGAVAGQKPIPQEWPSGQSRMISTTSSTLFWAVQSSAGCFWITITKPAPCSTISWMPAREPGIWSARPWPGSIAKPRILSRWP